PVQVSNNVSAVAAHDNVREIQDLRHPTSLAVPPVRTGGAPRSRVPKCMPPRRCEYGGGMPGFSARFLVVLDADSTLIRNEVIELIADEAGRGAEVAAATEAAMRGEVDFAESLRS